jgi:hypothetical protein
MRNETDPECGIEEKLKAQRRKAEGLKWFFSCFYVFRAFVIIFGFLILLL